MVIVTWKNYMQFEETVEYDLRCIKKLSCVVYVKKVITTPNKRSHIDPNK